MASQTRTQLQNTTTSEITTNGNKEITGQDLRLLLIDITDSLIIKGGDTGVSTISFLDGNGIDVDSSGSSDTLNIGTTNADIINIGRSGATVNIIGTTEYENVTNLTVSDKLITINKGGGTGTASGSGFEIEEDGTITGYFKTSSNRLAYLMKSPAGGGIATLITPAADQSYTFPANTGTIALTSDITPPVWGNITGTLSSQTDLQSALNAKEVALTFSTGLTRATNTITNNLSTGISGGQSVIGGAAAGNNLTLSSTSNGTKGFILVGNSGYDEVNNMLGLGIATSLGAKLHIKGSGSTSATYGLKIYDSSLNLNFHIKDDGEVSSRLGYWVNGTKAMYFGAGDTTNFFSGGTNAGNNTLTGQNNTIYGSPSGRALTSGTYNKVFGNNALYSATSANNNLAIHDYTLNALVTGDSNIAIGYATFILLNSSSGEVGLGYNVGYALTSGVGDTFIGYSSASGFTTSQYNTFVGQSTGTGATSGNQNCLFGANATITSGVNSSIAMGAYSQATSSNQLVAGSSSGGASITDVVFGVGSESSSIFNTGFTLRATNVATGQSNQASSASLILAGAKGTGTGVGGDIIFKVALAGSTGSTQNSYATKATLSGTTGSLNFSGSTTAGAQINLATGSAPTSPVDGDIWREDNTNTGLKIRINGVTKTVTVT